jgi:hypothetical protein
MPAMARMLLRGVAALLAVALFVQRQRRLTLLSQVERYRAHRNSRS